MKQKERSRHIPVEIRRHIYKESRGRCCLCRTPVPPGAIHKANPYEIHHIIPYKDGGGHHPENLVLLNPDCHRKIHKPTNTITPDDIKEKKLHWLQLASVVEPVQLFQGEYSCQHLCLASVPFRLVSFGLDFDLVVPPDVLVRNLLKFITSRILTPIGTADRDPELERPSQVLLSHTANPKQVFSGEQTLADIPLTSDDHLIVHVHRSIVAAPKGPLGTSITVKASPAHPAAGESYSVELWTDSPSPVAFAMEVIGTDGYKARHKGLAADTGPTKFNVPGARGGVMDTIATTGEFAEIELVIVFGSKLPTFP